MQNRKWCLENKDKRQESWRRYREKNRAKINEKTKKRRHENRETFNAERRARYHAKKIAQQVIGQESDLNADHVKIVRLAGRTWQNEKPFSTCTQRK